MEYLVISVVAVFASGLTLFSGFGLGTLLMPAFALFFPLPTAVALTAIVHLLNNLFKLALLGKHADRRVVLRFGLPAIVFAAMGAWLLGVLSEVEPLVRYQALGREAVITPVKLVIAALMMLFAFLEATRIAEGWNIPMKWLPLGGAVGGFFGGLSGHQGALRSAFLIRAGLSKESFIATGVVIACMIDVSRLGVYAAEFRWNDIRVNFGLIIAATLSAFVGAYAGTKLIRKVTIRQVQTIVAVMLAVIAVGLGSGMI